MQLTDGSARTRTISWDDPRLSALDTAALAAMPLANPAEAERRMPAGRNDWFGR